MDASEEKVMQLYKDAFTHEREKVAKLEADIENARKAMLFAVAKFSNDMDEKHAEIKKLEGWLKYLTDDGWYSHCTDIDKEISDYIKAMEGK